MTKYEIRLTKQKSNMKMDYHEFEVNEAVGKSWPEDYKGEVVVEVIEGLLKKLNLNEMNVILELKG